MTFPLPWDTFGRMESESRFEVRDYRPGDFAGISELWAQTGMSSPQRGDTAEVVERTLRLGGRLLVLAGASGEIAGSSWLTSDGRRLYLHHFAIAPLLQGRGLSKQLLDASLRVGRETGLQVKLEVHRDNVKAIRLYRRAGFSRLGDYEVYIIRDPRGVLPPEKNENGR